MTVFHTIWTVSLVIIFLLIARWAYSPRRRGDFEQAANLPFDDEFDKHELGKKTGETE